MKRLSRLRMLGRKALLAAPEVAMHPRQLLAASKGVHWATLNMLDQPWLKDWAVDTVLDVGANCGQFATASRAVFPRARIYSFEPLEDCYMRLCERMSLDPQFLGFNFAIGAEEGEAELNRSSFSESSSLLEMTKIHQSAFPWSSGATTVNVSIRSLDSFLPSLQFGSTTLLKIDVQGYEQAVLAGAEETLSLISIVIVEVSFRMLYVGEASFGEIYLMLTSSGFEFAGMLDQMHHPQTREILQGDAVFHRPKKTDLG